jgi:hypothetical protein
VIDLGANGKFDQRVAQYTTVHDWIAKSGTSNCGKILSHVIGSHEFLVKDDAS